jgi:hypothetical protein
MRFTTRTLTRAFTAAALSLLVAACDIGEGNGIVSIEIVELDGSSDYEMRADQCEGLLLAAIATFTDGQRNVYTHRVDWSVESGEGSLIELKNSFDLTTAAEIIPTVDTAEGDKIVVKASYLDLTTRRTITVNKVTVDSLQIEPPRVALIKGETQAISLLLTLSDGSLVSNPARAITAELDDETAFSLGSINFAGQQQLITNETTTGTANLTATFCARLDGDDPSANSANKTVSLAATNYNGNETDLDLEIIENFDGLGATPIDSGTIYRLPTDTKISIGTQLRFPNNVTRPLSLGLPSWSAEDGDGPCNDNNSCAATIDGVGSISSESAGQVTIDATYTTPDGTDLTAETPLVLNVAEIEYRTPSYELRDESNAAIDTNQLPAVSLTNGTARILRFVALLVDDKGTADTGDDEDYEIPVNPDFFLNNTNDADLLTVAGSILSAASEGSNNSITVNINTSQLPGASTADFSGDFSSFNVEVHQLAPLAIQIDADGNYATAEAAASVTVGNTLQLNSVLPFTGKDSVLQTGVTTWSVAEDDNEVASINNLSSDGLVTALSEGDAVITAKHSFTTADGTEYDSSATITITVTAAAP